MGVLECGAAVIGGVFDKFDIARGVVKWVAKQVEETEIPVSFHPESGLVESHFHDPKGEMLADLDRAIELIEEARQLTVTVYSQLP